MRLPSQDDRGEARNEKLEIKGLEDTANNCKQIHV